MQVDEEYTSQRRPKGFVNASEYRPEDYAMDDKAVSWIFARVRLYSEVITADREEEKRTARISWRMDSYKLLRRELKQGNY